VISDLLDSVAPALTRTVSLLEAAAAAPEQVKQGLRDVIEGVHGHLIAASGEGSIQLDFLIDSAGSEVARGKADPHVVTRGSGTGSTRGSGIAKKPSKPLKPRLSGDKPQ
jgi:hypothetical protein